MNTDGFVEECRREWSRLGVPGELAEEMADELRADLADAASDGVAAEELLGTGALDARGFAASWASERGVVPAAAPRRRRLLVGAALVLAAVGLAVGLVAARSTGPRHPGLAQAVQRRVVVLTPRTGVVLQVVHRP